MAVVIVEVVVVVVVPMVTVIVLVVESLGRFTGVTPRSCYLERFFARYFFETAPLIPLTEILAPLCSAGSARIEGCARGRARSLLLSIDCPRRSRHYLTGICWPETSLKRHFDTLFFETAVATAPVEETEVAEGCGGMWAGFIQPVVNASQFAKVRRGGPPDDDDDDGPPASLSPRRSCSLPPRSCLICSLHPVCCLF